MKRFYMEDFINTSFNDIISELIEDAQIEQAFREQVATGVNPLYVARYGLRGAPSPVYGEGNPEPLDTAVNPNA